MRRGAGVICLSGSKLLGNEPAIYLSDALLAIYKINGLVCALSLNKYRLVTIWNLHFSSALVIWSSPLLGLQLSRYCRQQRITNFQQNIFCIGYLKFMMLITELWHKLEAVQPRRKFDFPRGTPGDEDVCFETWSVRGLLHELSYHSNCIFYFWKDTI